MLKIRKKLVVFGIFLLSILSMFVLANAAEQDENVLIVYYSQSGNTEEIAEIIQEKTGGDFYKIEPVTPYSASTQEVGVEMQEERDQNSIREIEDTIPNVEAYDLILIGSPVWHAEPSNPVQKYLSKTDFSDKIVSGFWTCYSTPADYAENFASMVQNGSVLEGLELTSEDFSSSALDSKIDAWLGNLSDAFKFNTEATAEFDRADGKSGLEEVLSVKELYEEFNADPNGAEEKYRATPVIAEGVVLRTGSDIHGTPSVELSDIAGGERYATYVINSFDQLEEITIGDTVTMKGNFHIVSNSEWGVVMKQGEVIE